MPLQGVKLPQPAKNHSASQCLAYISINHIRVMHVDVMNL
jgi:hypothetical protein